MCPFKEVGSLACLQQEVFDSRVEFSFLPPRLSECSLVLPSRLLRGCGSLLEFLLDPFELVRSLFFLLVSRLLEAGMVCFFGFEQGRRFLESLFGVLSLVLRGSELFGQLTDLFGRVNLVGSFVGQQRLALAVSGFDLSDVLLDRGFELPDLRKQLVFPGTSLGLFGGSLLLLLGQLAVELAERCLLLVQFGCQFVATLLGGPKLRGKLCDLLAECLRFLCTLGRE